jgi:hypothetical protein
MRASRGHACIMCDAVSFSRAPFVHSTIKKIHNIYHTEDEQTMSGRPEREAAAKVQKTNKQ